VGVRLLVAAVAAVFLAGCEVYAVPNPVICPGERKGLFEFTAVQITANTDGTLLCPFANPADPDYQSGQVLPSFTFVAEICFAASGDGAALCPQVAHAVPNVGTHTGDTIDVGLEGSVSVAGCTCATPQAAAAGGCLCPTTSPSTCSCPVVQRQQFGGSLLPIAGGYSGFSGTIRYTVTPPTIPAGIEPCRCDQPCTYSYNLTATSVGSR
jgi:hypothetical protein